MSIQNLDPQVVWKNFYALTQIPRPSKHEELAVEYMYNWGKEHGLETIKGMTHCSLTMTTAGHHF